MIPVHCTIVPISSIASSLGAKNSYWFLVLVYIAFNLSQAVYLYIGFIQGIDKELDEAAIIDGCNDVSLLTKILTPICKPIIATESNFCLHLWLWRVDFLSDFTFQTGKVYGIQGNAEFHRGTFHRYGTAVCFHWECLKL